MSANHYRELGMTATTCRILLALAFLSAASPLWAQNSSSADAERSSDEEAREAILGGDAWKATTARFEEWLQVQKTYGPAEVEALRSELRNRVAQMSAEELAAFTADMEAKLNVLLDPAADAARQWVETYFTPKKQRELAAKYGVQDPIRMSSFELAKALEEFENDRMVRGAAAASFQQSQAAQVRGAENYRKSQDRVQAAAVQAARQGAGGGNYFGSHYAPTPNRNRNRVQTYQAPYKPFQYSVGPWGGVWVGMNR